ncbi:Double-strand break repair protein mre11 [Thalictrum thalictroides]|uniref:Double-strand break repair protein mre11 n=1 Tax=Thalictrum thalictroides TaxID=46969 RepID=A0A7J6XAW4_THATH|nr:Double-strand break repair protein mre11 [Thalictrum thalictroides]
MEILPVNDLSVALHDFVNKDDKMAFYSCLKYNLEETRSKISHQSDTLKFEEEDIIVKVGECMQERVKERSTRSKEDTPFSFASQSLQDTRSKSTVGLGSSNSFSDDEGTAHMVSSSKSTARGSKGSSVGFISSHDAPEQNKSKASTRGRGRGRGRGRASGGMKQTTLDATLGTRRSGRSASVRSTTIDKENVGSSSDEVEEFDANKDLEDSLPGKRNKRAAPRASPSLASKRGRKSDTSSIHQRLKKVQPRVTRNYGAIRK